MFPLGKTTVKCSAGDSSGNTAKASFTVTVRDTSPPTISHVPEPIATTATHASGAKVTYSQPTATDLVDEAVTVRCSPKSGATFATGTTQVTCSATDRAGNVAMASFEITVLSE